MDCRERRGLTFATLAGTFSTVLSIYLVTLYRIVIAKDRNPGYILLKLTGSDSRGLCPIPLARLATITTIKKPKYGCQIIQLIATTVTYLTSTEDVTHMA